MILSLLAAALVSGAAQTTPPSPVGQGLEPAAVRQWLIDHGGQAGPLSADRDPGFAVVDRGLNWWIGFPGCAAARCEDVQLSTAVEKPGLTPEAANAWNRDHRFGKAWFRPADAAHPAPAIILQYDPLVDPARGPEQLGDAINVWLKLVADFARVHGEAAPAGAPAS